MLKDQNFSYHFLVSILDSIPLGIMVLDEGGIITLANQLAIDFCKFDQNIDEVIGQPISKYLNNEVAEVMALGKDDLVLLPESFEYSEINFEEKILSIKGQKGLVGTILTIEDVTEIKTQEKLNLNAMLEGQETERLRLAREIHDGIGPILSTINLYLDQLRSDLGKESTYLSQIKAMGGLIHEVTDDLRAISHALMPSTLLDLGVVAALNNLCQKANESGRIQVDFFSNGLDTRLEESIALGIYRLAQELLNNAIKHSKANLISIQLIRHPESIVLMVEDDGVGFDYSNFDFLITKGIGLRNIQTRTEALNGVATIESQIGKGVIASIEIPVVDE